MKTTLDIADALLDRARRHARKTGRPLRAVVEDGLRRVLDAPVAATAYELPDRSVGDPRAKNPLASYSWPELRDEIYGGR
ncbi:MAG: DUF2191 domain-containing protein [Vicinamibacterales bacterium]